MLAGILAILYDDLLSLKIHFQRVNSLSKLFRSNNSQRKEQETQCEQLDNKFSKEPLSEKIMGNTDSNEEINKTSITTDQLERELKSVALDWKSSRNIEECACSTTFDTFNKKVCKF